MLFYTRFHSCWKPIYGIVRVLGTSQPASAGEVNKTLWVIAQREKAKEATTSSDNKIVVLKKFRELSLPAFGHGVDK